MCGWVSGGGGVKTSLRILGAVCGSGPRSRATFFLYMDPLTHGGDPGSELQVPPVAPPYGPLLVRTKPFSRWMRQFSDTCKISKNHLAEVVRSKPGRRIKGKTPHTPHFGPFWTYSRTLPQGVELLV